MDKVTDELLDRTLSFDVEVQDINDNAPYFQYPVMKATIKENVPSGDYMKPLTADMPFYTSRQVCISSTTVVQLQKIAWWPT